MNDAPDWDSQEFSQKLQEITTVIQDLAQQQQGNCQGLLLLLRTVEHLHREIREQLFEPSLPNTRKDVYNLLRDIEESGGWPYIERMRLKDLMGHLLLQSTENPSSSDSAPEKSTEQSVSKKDFTS